jgi:hypothetical protein
MTPEKEALASAYTTVQEAEKDLVTQLEALLDGLLGTLEEVEGTFPTEGSGSSARQLLTRLRSNLGSFKNFDLSSVKTAYGLNPVVTPAAVSVLPL